MEYADYVVLAIIAISILVGAIRGFVKEAFSLAVWAAAFLVAFQFSGALAMQLESHIELPSARTSLAFAGLFILVLLVGGLVTFLVGKLVEKTGLEWHRPVVGWRFWRTTGPGDRACHHARCRAHAGATGSMVADIENNTKPDAPGRVVGAIFARLHTGAPGVETGQSGRKTSRSYCCVAW